MNPLKTVAGTIIAGFILAAIIILVTGDNTVADKASVIIWLHVLAGITWIGLLYYFNFVQVPALGAAASDSGGPGGAGITKYVAPRALLWFRWGAVATWLTGAGWLAHNGQFVNAFLLGQNSDPVNTYALTIGMIDRGLVAIGMAADLVVLDPVTVIDRATYEEPALPSIGIRHVIVNGKLALSDGAATGVQGGRALRRGSSMPSRPMDSRAHRVVATAHPAYGGVTLTLNVSQSAGARAATGTFTISGDAGIRTITATGFGMLQAADGWISLTGRGRVNDGSERAFTITVDRHDPKPLGVALFSLTIDGDRSHGLHLSSVTIQ